MEEGGRSRSPSPGSHPACPCDEGVGRVFGVAREFPPSIHGCLRSPSSIFSTGWRVGKGRQAGKGRRRKNLELTALPVVASGGQIVVTGQPGLGKRNPGKTGDGSGTGP